MARAGKTNSDYGPVYRGHEGQYSWLLHRITGVAVILFLFAHVVDTAKRAALVWWVGYAVLGPLIAFPLARSR